jgi:hypothetical protein
LSVCLYFYLSAYLSVYPYVCLLHVPLSLYLSMCVSTSLSICCLSFWLYISVSQAIYLSIFWLSVCLYLALFISVSPK